MTVYVAEIAGRGIAAFDASTDIEAEAQLADKEFLGYLLVLQHKGRSLWDGVSEIRVRRALPEEAETWQASRAVAIRSGETADDSNRPVFLIPVVDPSDDKFDDGDDDDDHDGD